MSLTAEEILVRAAELVEESWTQDATTLDYDDGPYCAGLALNKAERVLSMRWASEGALDLPVSTERVQAWRALCREIGVTGFDNIPIWNDMPGRRKEEVAMALRNAKRWL